MSQTYYQDREVGVNNALVHRYMTDCDDTLEENIRMGCVSALGAMPRFMLAPCLKEVMHMLIKQSLKLRTDQSQVTCTWAESRRDAVKAISNVVATFGFEDAGCLAVLDEVFACYLKALLEYTIDDRGDIGAWVREAAMNGKLYEQIDINIDLSSFLFSNLYTRHNVSRPSAATGDDALNHGRIRSASRGDHRPHPRSGRKPFLQTCLSVQYSS